jgi:hypothetical protein
MNRLPLRLHRRWVLGTALLLALLVALLPAPPSVRAAESAAGGPSADAGSPSASAESPPAAAPNDGKDAAAAAKDAIRAADESLRQSAREAAAEAKTASQEARRLAAEAEADVGDARDRAHRKRITINMGGADREYDSFDQFLDRDPALAGGVLGIVFIVFLTPILFTALIIWYKMRKNRMQNEMMLKLAEKGIVPPGEAMQAIGAGRADAALGVAASSAPLAEQARALRKQAAWSDLRKGVLMGAIGFALVLYGIISDGDANVLGLVLLFVGVGYIVLWYFEDQQVTAAAAAARAARPVPAPGPGDAPN